jgi:hypothetical protein
MTRGHDDERQKADQLHAKEGKPNSHERIGLHMGHMDQGLANAGHEHGDAQVVDERARDADRRYHEYDGAEHRQIFDTVCVGSSPPPIPILALDLIASER